MWNLFKSALLVLFSLLPLEAGAVLGEYEATVSEDGVKPGRTYTVHQTNANSLIVKEFVSAQGVVFAVTWQGAKNPDLETLLGDYHSSYQKSFKATRATKERPGQDRRHVMINSDDLVVNRGGRAPHLRGTAYAPPLLPSGFNLEDLK